MKKVFISHPFTGDEKNNREDAARMLAELQRKYRNVQFFNPLDIFFPMEGLCEEVIILAGCMKLIRQCDVVIQCDGWEKSAGCRAEAAFAILNDIPCIEPDDFIELGDSLDD